MRPAMRAATNAEKADSNPAQKKIAPLTASDSPKRFCSHTTSRAVMTKPPPNESTLNSTANRYTIHREACSATGAFDAGSMAGERRR
jgi:hypothetical protein